jgi:multidrug efflux system outer membrane protein
MNSFSRFPLRFGVFALRFLFVRDSKGFGTLAAIAVMLSGCISLAPDYERPAAELPAGWSGPAGESTAVGAQWWKVYGDPQLDRLVEEALASNADLAAAVARVDEARAQLGETRAAQFPTLQAGVDASRVESSLRTATPLPPGVERVNNNYRATLDMSYELDLWGRLRDASAAARAELLATEAARETVRIVLAADVVQAYYALRALDEQVAATQRSLVTRSESLSLQQLRFEHGTLSEFEYRQREAEVEAARAQLPVLERRRAEQESALAVLLGNSPKAVYEGTVVEHLPPVPDPVDTPSYLFVPAGLPAELLLRRPDLVEAEQRLIAANARIGVARAAYLPSITLTGFLGNASAELSDLFSGPAGISGVAAAIGQPIFTGWRISSQVDAASALERQALAQYQRAIQNAFRDVRNALVAQTKTREQFEAEHRHVAALRETLRLAQLRYENGVASQLDVLDAERNLLAAELNRSDALRARRAAVADLFKALGGGWGADSGTLSRHQPGAFASPGSPTPALSRAEGHDDRTP